MCSRRGLADGTFEQCGSGQVKAKGLVDGVVAGCFPQLYSPRTKRSRSSYYTINQIKLLKYKQGNLMKKIFTYRDSFKNKLLTKIN